MYDSLVPVMYAKDYEEIAQKFLQDVYPKALVNNTPPDPRDIAESLGLTVIERSITEDCSILARYIFVTAMSSYTTKRSRCLRR